MTLDSLALEQERDYLLTLGRTPEEVERMQLAAMPDALTSWQMRSVRAYLEQTASLGLDAALRDSRLDARLCEDLMVATLEQAQELAQAYEDTESEAAMQMAEAEMAHWGETHTDHCWARLAWGDGECECGGVLPDESRVGVSVSRSTFAEPCIDRNGHDVYFRDGTTTGGTPHLWCARCGRAVGTPPAPVAPNGPTDSSTK